MINCINWTAFSNEISWFESNCRNGSIDLIVSKIRPCVSWEIYRERRSWLLSILGIEQYPTVSNKIAMISVLRGTESFLPQNDRSAFARSFFLWARFFSLDALLYNLSLILLTRSLSFSLSPDDHRTSAGKGDIPVCFSYSHWPFRSYRDFFSITSNSKKEENINAKGKRSTPILAS